MILSLFFFAVLVSSSYGQTKAVVIPLSSSKPAVVAYEEADETVAVGTTDQIIRSVTLEAPGKGLVIVNASGNTFTGSASGAYLICSITQLTAVGTIRFQEGHITTPPSYWNPWGATRAFAVNAGTQTFNLVCYSDGQMSVQDVIMNAVFHSVPTIEVPTSPLAALESNQSCPDDTDPSCN